MNNGLRESESKIIQNTFTQIKSIEEAILFGSRAKGNFNAGSDVDIVIKGCNSQEIIKLSILLNEETILPYFFDILSFESIKNQELLQHINRVGQVLYSRK